MKRILTKKLSVRRIVAAVKANEMTGFCTSCGAEQGNVEPDATKYKCENCGQNTVYGAEELVMREL
jgi:predicted RNA-binding Zn-ribbon protein involved in translation (DUF1610 family)